MFRNATLAVLFSTTALLAACGGGVSPPSPPPPPPPTPLDVQAAKDSQLTATSDPAAKVVTLTWFDTFPAGTTYRVESMQPDGSFASIASFAGLGDASIGIRWQHALGEVAALRVRAEVEDRELLLYTPHRAQVLTIEIPERLPHIVLDQVGPLASAVGLSIDDRVHYMAYAWYDEDELIDSHSNSPGAFVRWSAGYPNGKRDLSVRLETSADSWVAIHREVEISESNYIYPTYSLWADVDKTYVDIDNRSGYSLSSVTASLDGGPPVVLEATRSCPPQGCSDYDRPVYEYAIDNATHLGPHTLDVILEDVFGHIQHLGVPFTINAASFTPGDGAIVWGTLDLAGTVRAVGSVNVEARFDGKVVLTDASTPFATSYDLSGTAAGEHELEVYVDDYTYPHAAETHTVFVAPGPEFVYPQVITLGRLYPNMLAAEGDLLLYESRDGKHLRNTSTGTDTLLSRSAAVAGSSSWQVEGGRVFAAGHDTLDCSSNCVYRWNADGTRINISADDPIQQGHYGPYARPGGVVWSNSSGYGASSLTFLDSSTGRYSSVAGSLLSIRDVGLYGGSVHAYYSSHDPWMGEDDVMDWSPATGTSTLLFSTYYLDVAVSDGTRLGWANDCYCWETLHAYPLAGGNSVSLDSRYTGGLVAGDGVFAWYGIGGIVTNSKGVRTVLPPGTLYGTAGGVVVFKDKDGLKTWDAATGKTTLKFAAEPNQVLVRDGVAYFTVLDTNIVYKMPLP